MSRGIIFIGEPGCFAPAVFETVAAAGLAVECRTPENAPDGPSETVPLALMVDANIPDLPGLMGSLRENPALASVPVIARIPDPDSDLLDRAFALGVDDYFPDGATHQFQALLVAVTSAEPWTSMRALAGRVLLAHGDRLERIRYGTVLRRNGFDPFFSATAGDLSVAIEEIAEPRAIVAVVDIFRDACLGGATTTSDVEGQPPLVLIVRRNQTEEARIEFGNLPNVRYLDSSVDAESLTFLLNELLSPAPPNVRRSPRLLYHTPVLFRPSGQSGPALHGYSFNINLNGLFLRTLTCLPLQAKLDLTFRPPFGRGAVVLTAQVVWRKVFADARGAATPPGVGVQFVESGAADVAGFETGYRRLAEEAGEGLATIPAPPL